MQKNIFSIGDNPLQYGAMKVARFIDTEAKDNAKDGQVQMWQVQIKKAEKDKLKEKGSFLDTCLITSLRYQREVAVQPEPTIGGELFINHFGDKPTQYFIEGIAFDHVCNDKEETSTGTNYDVKVRAPSDPPRSLIEFYDNYRLQRGKNPKETEKAGQQVVLTTYNTLSGKYIKYVGLLISMVMDLTCDQYGRRQYNFSMIFLAIQ